MRGINLITNKDVGLSEWAPAWQATFSKVWVRHDEELARREGHPPSTSNEVVIERGNERVYIYDRPTTVREYEPEEIETLKGLAGSPKRFFALDYSDEVILRDVLEALRGSEYGEGVFVDDDEGFLALSPYLQGNK